jgi:hypothetical protein
MPWIIRHTDTFLESFRRVRDNSKLVSELARKIKRLLGRPTACWRLAVRIAPWKKINTDCKTVPAACRRAARGDRIIVNGRDRLLLLSSGDLMFLLNPEKHTILKKNRIVLI